MRSIDILTTLATATLLHSAHGARPRPSEANMTAPKVILDNDWGIAQFIPYLIALDAGWDILGLVSDTSDSWALQTGLHALATLERGGLSDCIPVYRGADYPLLQTPNRFQAYEALLGTLPWEGVFKRENITAEAEGGDPTSGDPGRIVRAAFEMPYYGYPNATFAEDTPAAMFMVEQVRKYPGEITIYSGGALTNIALAVRMDPTFAQNTKGLFIMGGYVDRMVQQTTGDVFQASLVSDINFVVDPEAAKIALSAAFPKITLVGNAANLLISTQEFLDEIYEVKNPYSELVHAYYGTGLPFWDETAAAVMVDPSIVTDSVEFYVDIDTAYSSPYYGYIRPYQAALMPPGLRSVSYVNNLNLTALASRIKHSVQYPKGCADLASL
ncbi:Inosine/uridine-preferring nucleoside hydrolase domain-containing protein [Mycena albidolilacea]|uniref:Inosine/uridine-preferring nucleoside hydrolase domain-containing protein n=1 Tax=Mycena albidolilacea TaxID=1033008 RepID=A0AAD7E7D1_9AGAR|nr:Inosine/uridine-preferring nucleoside hydrolase domain-containing protein [Mycena albidolilacea]